MDGEPLLDRLCKTLDDVQIPYYYKKLDLDKGSIYCGPYHVFESVYRPGLLFVNGDYTDCDLAFWKIVAEYNCHEWS